MNYLKHYNLLCDRSIGRLHIEGVYTEKHHIIPRCLGGSDDSDNLVILTPEEHFVAHQLLVKIYPNNRKLIFAATQMCTNGRGQQRHNNKQYGWLKRQRSSIGLSSESIIKRTQTRRDNGVVAWNKGIPSTLRGIPRTEEVKLKISQSQPVNNKGRSVEGRQKMVNTRRQNSSYTRSEESRKKQREAAKGRKWKLNVETGSREYYRDE